MIYYYIMIYVTNPDPWKIDDRENMTKFVKIRLIFRSFY